MVPSRAPARPAPSPWLAEHVAAITASPATTIPPIAPAALAPLIPGMDLWDLWPLQGTDGATVRFGGWSLWFVLSAPALPDPDHRHDVARIRLMSERDGAWRDCGDALPDGLNPGSREWAGSALYDVENSTVTLFYTVAGLPGETTSSFVQRLFQTSGTLVVIDGEARITGWTTPIESLAADDETYVRITPGVGVPGHIKGFRDPAHFRDPASGETYLVFTASLKPSAHSHNGCVGLARARDGSLSSWEVLPPLVSADALNNEQERPLLIARDGLIYLFWSTQRRVFAPDGPSGPNGLYGMVAEAIEGPWRPLNGTGLVAANPEETPFQAYSWWVTQDLEVAGFADYPGVGPHGVVDTAGWRRAHFAATPAPRFRIALDGARATVVA